MPTYEYACKSCGEHLEVVQSFKDDALTECPACRGQLRKVFGNIGITFKGSGFYKTDNRGKPSATKPAETSSGESTSKPADKPADKPAASASSGSSSSSGSGSSGSGSSSAAAG